MIVVPETAEVELDEGVGPAVEVPDSYVIGVTVVDVGTELPDMSIS